MKECCGEIPQLSAVEELLFCARSIT